jgi:Ca2+-binding EF-hand superfamily protein
MKKRWLLAGLALCLMGTLGSPANAKKEVWFERYDTNGDGLWNYDEFTAANEHYIVTHPSEVRVTTKELRHQFDDFDADHDGLVRVEEVRKYHTWD